MANVDWIKIKNEYINGNISHKKLAEKHNVPYPTLRDRAKKEKWFDERTTQRSGIVAQTLQKTAEKLSDEQSNYIVDISKLNHGIANVIAKIIEQKDTGELLKPNDIKALTGALKDIKDIQKADDATGDSEKLNTLRSIFESVKNGD